MRIDDDTIVHAFISPCMPAAVWVFWHIAKAIHQESRASDTPLAPGFKYAVVLESGNREKAVLLMVTGRSFPLSAQQVRLFAGLDPSQAPFTQEKLALGKTEIEQLMRWLSNTLKLSNLITYEPGNEKILSDFFPAYYAPPAELQPSKWSEPTKPFAGDLSQFTSPAYPARNPALAFSQYANDLLCPYCNHLNVAPAWPPRGDLQPFRNLKKDQAQAKPGSFSLKVACPACHQDWFVVWER